MVLSDWKQESMGFQLMCCKETPLKANLKTRASSRLKALQNNCQISELLRFYVWLLKGISFLRIVDFNYQPPTNQWTANLCVYIYIQWYVHCLITHNYKCIQYIRYISHSPLKLGLPLIHPMVYHHFAYETGHGWGYPPFSHTFLDEQLEIRVIFIPSARPSLWLSLLPPVSLPFPTCPVALRLHLKF
jgi:hypothetical protein